VNPCETVVCRGRGDDCICRPKTAVDILKALEKSRHRARAYGDVLADGDVARPQSARDHLEFLARLRVFDQQKVLGQPLAEAAMDFSDGVDLDSTAFDAAGVDPFLHGNMRRGLPLEIASLPSLLYPC